MLATAPVIAESGVTSTTLDVPVVVDPVMVAATGDRLLAPTPRTSTKTCSHTRHLRRPMLMKPRCLTGIELTDHEGTIQAGKALLETGVDAALVKGGRRPY